MGFPLGCISLTADFAGLKRGVWIGFIKKVDIEFFVAMGEMGWVFKVEIGEDE